MRKKQFLNIKSQQTHVPDKNVHFKKRAQSYWLISLACFHSILFLKVGVQCLLVLHDFTRRFGLLQSLKE